MMADNNFESLVNIIKRLRQPDGCPWDQKQTIDSFKPYLLEEMHELLEAIEENDPDHIKEELGDLFFQAIFINNLYEEQGHFNLEEVLLGISAKMIRRHPHVFGDKKFANENEMRANWNRVKAQEKSSANAVAKKSLFSFPKTMPALTRAQRVSDRAAKSGFEWPDIACAFAKLDEEINELKEAVATGRQENIKEELGDTLLTLVNIGRLAELHCEDALHCATEKFTTRFTSVAEQVEKESASMHELPIEKLLLYWQKAKQETK